MQRAMIMCGLAINFARVSLPLLLTLSVLLRNTADGSETNNTYEVAVDYLLQLQIANITNKTDALAALLRLDHYLHDIPFWEEQLPRQNKPRQRFTILQWSDKECYDRTGFRQIQLQKIYNCFGLAEVAAQNRDGRIRVYRKHYNQRNVRTAYTFDPEEIFLFFMTKFHTGDDNTKLCNEIFGGYVDRWKEGFPWMVRYIDNRYESVLGYQGLMRYYKDFPTFHSKLEQRVQKDLPRHQCDGRRCVYTHLHYLPFNIFGFIDCSIFKTSVPFSGPDGDFIGAPRKPKYTEAQRSIYTKFKKVHGIKVEAIMLPNGIMFVYGPVSCRVADVGGVVRMSNVDQFLTTLQEAEPQRYYAFGDSPYGTRYLQSICSYFFAVGGGRITDAQQHCNYFLKSIRESIEWSFAEISHHFRLCDRPEKLKLGAQHPYAIELLRCSFLLMNIYSCMNGSHASSINMFDISPPTLEQYLQT